VRPGTVDLTDALEQALFGALRLHSGPGVRPWDTPRSLLRLGAATVRGLRPGSVPPGRLLVLVRRSIRADVFRPIGQILEGRGVPSPIVVALEPGLARGIAPDLQLWRQLRAGAVPGLLEHALAVGTTRLPLAEWSTVAPDVTPQVLMGPVRNGLPRYAMYAAQLEALVRRSNPSAIIAFQEVGGWARVIPAVGRALGVPTIDLPHAEAADPIGAFKLDYDALLVYGPRSTAVLRNGGNSPERIHEVGPLRYDALVAAMQRARRSAGAPDAVRRVIFASQPVQDRAALTRRDKLRYLRCATAAAAAVGPSELVVRPHPNESVADLEGLMAEVSVPGGLRVVVERGRDLHDLLPDAWLLITGSSQSVFEAAIAGIPTITTSPIEAGLVTHVQEGFSLGADDPDSAAEVAASLLDPATRAAAVARSAAALRDRFGELDGRAAERAADVIESVVRDRRSAAPSGAPPPLAGQPRP
jgi:hypothetical protein